MAQSNFCAWLTVKCLEITAFAKLQTDWRTTSQNTSTAIGIDAIKRKLLSSEK
jgi:hypothetical protein